MASPVTEWSGPDLTTSSELARLRYREAVVALVAGVGTAERLFDGAVAADPDFALARLGRTVSRLATGRDVAPAVIDRAGLTRGERQHVEIVELMLAGSAARAIDLRREHLVEYPGDLLIVWLPALDSSHT